MHIKQHHKTITAHLKVKRNNCILLIVYCVVSHLRISQAPLGVPANQGEKRCGKKLARITPVQIIKRVKEGRSFQSEEPT